MGWLSFDSSLVRRRCFILLCSTVLVVGGGAQGAQARLSIIPAVSISGTYTDNLFFSETNKQEDYGTFISPQLTVFYESKNVILSGTYTGTAQFFLNNSSANAYAHGSNIGMDFPFLTRRYEGLDVKVLESFNFSPQLDAFSFSGQPVVGIGLGGEGVAGSPGRGGDFGGGPSFQGSDTRLPGEFGGGGVSGSFGESLNNQGIFTARSDAFQNQAGLLLRYRWRPRLTPSVSYQNQVTIFTNDQFEDTMTHDVNTQLAYQWSRRTQVRTSYQASVTDSLRGTNTFVVHAVNVGGEYRFSNSLTVSTDVGGAVTDSNLSFITDVSLRKNYNRGFASLQYGQSIQSGGGLAVSATLNQTVLGDIGYQFTSRMRSYFGGALSRNTSLSGSDIDVETYQGRVGASYNFLSWLRGSIEYSHVFQESSGAFGNDAQANQVFVTLQGIARPWRLLK